MHIFFYSPHAYRLLVCSLSRTHFFFSFSVFFCTPNSIHIQTGIVLLLFLYLGYIFFVYFLLYFLSIFSFSFLFYILPITHCFFLHFIHTSPYVYYSLLFFLYSTILHLLFVLYFLQYLFSW